ncbi:single-minded homolog 2-like [Uloborus diversus]|uniref:single-minded homolog 2-like n=1 Tax=Uloborus diversus TaxID=327109 RepID=UPI0024098B10|nr:single-minded homolog 2-like [Uloborus diversus]
MKERSKTAARTRRENENAEFEQLAKLLPLPSNITSHLDKASVIRLTTSYLKIRKLFPSGLGEDWGAEPATSTDSSRILKELSSHLLLSLDGFVFMLDPDGKVIYVSETASVHLGLSQIEMTGNSIYDFIHQSDYEEMRSILNPELSSQQKCFYENLEIQLKFCLRMKCVLAKRNAGLAVDGYKVIHCGGYLKLRKESDALNDGQLTNSEAQKANQQYQVAGLVAIGQSLPSSSITDIKMSSHTFMFRASLDFTLIYLGARITAFTGYEPHKMVDKTLYQFVHCCDSVQLQMEHRSLLSKGQVITKYYRLLTKSGEWIWIQSYCTLINSNKASKPHCIVALNHVIRMDLNPTSSNGTGTDISETEVIPFDKSDAMFTAANKDPSAFAFDGTPSSEPVFDNFTNMTVDMENESFSDVDYNWLSNPYLAGCDLTVLRRWVYFYKKAGTQETLAILNIEEEGLTF